MKLSTINFTTQKNTEEELDQHKEQVTNDLSVHYTRITIP